MPSPLQVHQLAGFSWGDEAKVRTYKQYTGVKPFPSVFRDPVYVIEKLGSMGVPPGESELDAGAGARTGYRITARATGAREDTVVVLQSVYSR